MDRIELERLVAGIKDYQLTHGFLLKVVRLEGPTTVPCHPVGISVLPTPFPRQCYEEAQDLQLLYNELYMRAASDEEWLYGVLKDVILHDRFVEALWRIYCQVKEAGVLQELVCGIFRSDYMLHQPLGSVRPMLKQVEMNTFSVAGACHSQRAADLHGHFHRLRGSPPPRLSSKLPELTRPEPLPSNHSTRALVDVLTAAHETYQPVTAFPTCVLMVVQPWNYNVADERPIEYGLWDQGVACYRCEWQDIMSETVLEAGNALQFQYLDRMMEVSVVYFRAGYEAREYDPAGIQGRLRLEMSRAIKCPDILTHLTTFKAVQQALTSPGAVERFLPAEHAFRIRDTFMPIYLLDASAPGLYARSLATSMDTAGDYVLKPNLEGGGNNVYRQDIPAFLGSIPKDQWGSFILMHLIESPAREGILMQPNSYHLYQGSVVSELGILGTCLWRRVKAADGSIEKLRNVSAGWTFKTKPTEIDEMSVVKGYGCFDCPLLIDEKNE